MQLNPDSEFEAILIDMVRVHREKSVGYGQEDPMWNFYEGSRITGLPPLRFLEALLSKHLAALKNWYQGGSLAEIPPPTKFSDDAFIDRAVYSVLAIVLYRRLSGQGGSGTDKAPLGDQSDMDGSGRDQRLAFEARSTQASNQSHAITKRVRSQEEAEAQ